MPRFLNRRQFVGLASLAMAGAGTHRALARQASPGLEIRGDCLPYPAATMLLDFATNNLDRLPYTSVDELLPGADWQIAESPELGLFLVPPRWSVITAWANSFTSDQTPDWQPKQMTFPFWALTAAISPDQSAAYMHVTGGVDDVYLSPDDGIDLARTTVMGKKARSKELCGVGQSKGLGMMDEILWMGGHLYSDELLLTKGSALLSTSSGPSLGPGSNFTFEALVAQEDESERYMKDIFMRILWQFVPKGGGASSPTPTPTPES